MGMPWLRGKPRVLAGDAGRESERARADAAQEIRELRVSTAAGLERLTAGSAQASAKSGWDKAAVIIQAIGAVAIIIPLIALFVSISQFNEQQRDSSAATLEQQRVDAAAALDQQRQATLNGYFDDMSALVLQDKLTTSKPGAPVRAIAVARTLTAVRDLDGARKATLIRYLKEAGLLTGARPIVNIQTGDLDGAVFSNATLDGIALFQVFLDNAQFIDNSSLVGADLKGSYLYEADLATANLTDADLQGSFPIGANFTGADLAGADLAGADLTGADLAALDDSDPNLADVDLKGARYNSKLEYVHTPHGGNEVIEKPTQWPPGFNPGAAGAFCYDCGNK